MSDSIQIAAAAVELVETNVTSTAGKNVILLNSKAKAEETVAVGDQENNANGEIKSPTTKALTEAEKLELRMKKFGVQSENAKLTIRAERFGVTTPATENGKLEKRAQRFGASVDAAASATGASNGGGGVSAEVLDKRAKRFGMPATTQSEEVLNKRKERFGIVDEESKKKQRSERFKANKV